MALPKFRKSKSKTMMRRRQNDKRVLMIPTPCPSCGALKLPHRVCNSCGSYKGKTVIQKS